MNYTRGIFACVCVTGILLCLANAQVEKAPAQFLETGSFSGGKQQDGIVLNGVRFGSHGDYTRMVLDFETTAGGAVQAHPLYTVTYLECPYRLVVTMPGVGFNADAKLTTKPALPFSVVTPPSGEIKEIQIFLTGPSEFKVIEIDDPAKLSIDVRPSGQLAPRIYSVQISGPETAAEAYSLVEQGEFPEGFVPHPLILGDVVVVECAFTDPSLAADYDARLREMGYASVINERQGNELPLS